jgi:transcriptional regulator
MYTPKDFRVDDTAEAHALIRANPFAVLVTHGADGIVATHLPTVLKIDDGAMLGRIECHVARPNQQWRTFAADTDALMIFQGPEAYIRPGWYPSKAEHDKVVPTWNYAVVHAYGRLEVVQDQAWLLAHVSELTQQQEGQHAAPWKTADAPEYYLAMMLRGIVGLKFTITRLEGKAKMSQNREPRDRAGVVRGLADRAQGQDSEVASLVEKMNR